MARRPTRGPDALRSLARVMSNGAAQVTTMKHLFGFRFLLRCTFCFSLSVPLYCQLRQHHPSSSCRLPARRIAYGCSACSRSLADRASNCIAQVAQVIEEIEAIAQHVADAGLPYKWLVFL